MSWEEKKTLEGFPYYYQPSTEAITWEKPAELQTAEEKELSQGDWTWVPHPVDLWEPALRLNTNADGSTDCRTQAGKMVTIPADGVLNSPLTHGKPVTVPLWPLHRTALLFKEDDLVMLDQLNDAMIISNLRTRYATQELYTWVGAARSVLVSVNPYQNLPLYGNDQIHRYRYKPPNTKNPPHVFDIANDAYNSLLFERRNQSILISGESGAGKTVATKHCLKFLAQVAGSKRNVEERVIQANPLLEAYGNAQTIRNNNSSRFGKWIQVNFHPLERSIISAEITNYLLEKSRLVGQQAGERNYHVFYQLTKDSTTRSDYKLDPPQSYRYTNQSGCFDARGIDDLEELADVKSAMQGLGFSPEEEQFCFGVAAAVLKIGNVEFDLKPEKNNVQGSKLKSAAKAVVKQISDHLGVKEADLAKVLSYRTITVRGVTNTIPLDPLKARASADSLAMAIYGKLFNWLVRRVNTSLKGADEDQNVTPGQIGILDIFGFEIFDENSFEQLCINFANEKLQQQFNRTTFKEEEALYVKEAIKFTHIEFIDNQEVCDLVEKPGQGLLPLLDDECVIPEGSDKKFISKLEDKFQSHDKFQTDTKRKLQDSFNFEIVHYAGMVRYNANGFIVKNTDSISNDQAGLCALSTSTLVKALFDEVVATTAGASRNVRTGKTSNNRSKKAAKSVSYEFRQQLNMLLASLQETDSRYIRCVKPNNEQASDKFQAVLVYEQLKYSGVFEAVEIRKQGFPFRLNYNQFACRYGCINLTFDKYDRPIVKAYDNARKGSEKDLCKEILSASRYKEELSPVVFGKTRCLYKTAEHRLLTLLREFALEKLIPRAQSVMRGWIPRQMARLCRKCDVKLQAAMDVANDLEMLDQALADIDPTLGPFMLNYFPGVYPSLKKEALRRRAALIRWKELEAEYQSVVGIVDGTKEDFDRIDALVKEGTAILDTPMTETQKQLYEEALEQRNYLEVRVEREEIESNLEHYSSLANYSGMRDPKDYTKKVTFTRKSYEEVMYCWQKGRLPHTLTVALGDEKEEIKNAKVNLDNIQFFIGQKNKPKKDKREEADIVNDIFSRAKSSPEWADEVWVQLIKMVTNHPTSTSADKNPKPEHLERLWQLIAMAVFVLQPSAEFERFILCKFREAPDGLTEQFTSAFHKAKYTTGWSDMPDFTMMDQIKGVQRNRFSMRHQN